MTAIISAKLQGFDEDSATDIELDRTRRIQTSLTLTYPKTITAIYYHSEETDLWAPVAGHGYKP